MRLLTAAILVLGIAGCCPAARHREAVDLAATQQQKELSCDRPDHCGIASPLRELGNLAVAASSPDAPRHRVLLLEAGQDSLLARIHLIRSAQTSIELQSFIFAEDDAGFFTLNELLHAARRGVKVRILLDQLFSVEDIHCCARLAQSHVTSNSSCKTRPSAKPAHQQSSSSPAYFAAFSASTSACTTSCC